MLSLDELNDTLIAVPFNDRIAYVLPSLIAFYTDSVEPIILQVTSLLQARQLRQLVQPPATWDIQQHLKPFLDTVVLPVVEEVVAQSYLVWSALGLCVLLMLSCISRKRSRSVGSQDLYKPLNALMTVVAPTTSLWSGKYIRIARKAARSRQHTLLLSLYDLQNDYICGNLELRHSAKLPELMRNTLLTDGWRIRLHASVVWRSRVLMYLIKAYLGHFVPRVSLIHIRDLKWCMHSAMSMLIAIVSFAHRLSLTSVS